MLVSVLNKQGLGEDLTPLSKLGEWSFIGSKGSAVELNAHKIKARDVAIIVGGEPILGHRVVTISREIAAGLVGKNTTDDRNELHHLGIPFIDVVYVGLYDLEAALQREDADLDTVLESTDVGGILLIHAAVKGKRVVVTNRAALQRLLPYLLNHNVTEEVRRQFAAEAEFEATYYLAMVTRYHNGGRYDPDMRGKLEEIVLGRIPDRE